MDQQFFTKQLLKWAKNINRPMPWKGEKNPYYIWLSEIILQQTRVEQGLPYFLKFKEKYPTVHDLANAEEDEVMKLWEGLGYYSRARNLHFSAKNISKNLHGEFPKTLDEILKLKGVGVYTAAAIASFAYDLPHAVVDGNVYRVLSRYFGIETPIDSTEGKKEFSILANVLLKKNKAAIYNQAIMDFGAIQCTPKLTNCKDCSLKKNCQAFQKGKVSGLPVKAKKIKKKTRYFNYLLLKSNGEVWVKKRTQKDIWQNLYEFPLIETEVLLKNNILSKNEIWNNLIKDFDYELRHISSPFRQQLTHRTIIATFLEIDLPVNFSIKKNAYIKVERKNLSRFAFPKIIDLYLKDNSLNLYSMFQDLK
ncbi:MAG: A/G-specific adenine glycosylase [Saprospiraceae bacterium]|nr:A/G-specific adenine glycosylase [Saprospiraceae bacterium]